MTTSYTGPNYIQANVDLTMPLTAVPFRDNFRLPLLRYRLFCGRHEKKIEKILTLCSEMNIDSEKLERILSRNASIMAIDWNIFLHLLITNGYLHKDTGATPSIERQQVLSASSPVVDNAKYYFFNGFMRTIYFFHSYFAIQKLYFYCSLLGLHEFVPMYTGGNPRLTTHLRQCANFQNNYNQSERSNASVTFDTVYVVQQMLRHWLHLRPNVFLYQILRGQYTAVTDILQFEINFLTKALMLVKNN